IGDPLHGHDDYVQSVAFSPDGTRIVSGSIDDQVRIWHSTNHASNNSSPPISHDDVNPHWILSSNGWIQLSHIPSPIIWIPHPFRRMLWTPGTKCIISRFGYNKLSFQNCVYGMNWTQCISDL
ncbi:hypothetical protein GYMLUDRAFT_252533, partial [Collybiopsis luxurians FD-317 M1]